jgi:RNase LS, bacterial toxin DBD domain/RNase LS, bacterial toxin/RNase LS, bacterial toxin N-terminal
VSSDFKELNIVKNRLEESIQKFWEANNCQQGKYFLVRKGLDRAEYVQDGCQVTVDFYCKNNGTITIQTKVGKNHDKGEQLAIYLRDELVDDDRKSISVSIKNIDEDSFNLLLEFLKDLKSDNSTDSVMSVLLNSEDSLRKVMKITSKYNDSLTLTHHLTTNRLQIQGKPLYIYNQVCYLLAELTDTNGFFAIVHKGEEFPNTINVDKNTIENTLKALLPNAYSNLDLVILKMIRTSYTLKDISIPLDDYTCYVFPSLRALEGVMRKLLFEKEFSIEDNNNSFFGVFYFEPTKRAYVVKNDFRQKINDDKTCDALECCYDYFKSQRHQLFHANDLNDTSRIISTQLEASKIIEKVVKIIEEAYSKLLS